jgi:hypothetical protein
MTRWGGGASSWQQALQALGGAFLPVIQASSMWVAWT